MSTTSRLPSRVFRNGRKSPFFVNTSLSLACYSFPACRYLHTFVLLFTPPHAIRLARLKMPILQDIFRDQWWIDISYQLLCFGLLDASQFDGPLLRSDIPNGIWLGNQLVRFC